MSSVLRVFGRIVSNASRFHMLVDGQNFMKSCRQLMEIWLTRSLQRSGKRRGVSIAYIYLLHRNDLTCIIVNNNSAGSQIRFRSTNLFTLIKECFEKQHSPHLLPSNAPPQDTHTPLPTST